MTVQCQHCDKEIVDDPIEDDEIIKLEIHSGIDDSGDECNVEEKESVKQDMT